MISIKPFTPQNPVLKSIDDCSWGDILKQDRWTEEWMVVRDKEDRLILVCISNNRTYNPSPFGDASYRKVGKFNLPAGKIDRDATDVVAVKTLPPNTLFKCPNLSQSRIYLCSMVNYDTIDHRFTDGSINSVSKSNDVASIPVKNIIGTLTE